MSGVRAAPAHVIRWLRIALPYEIDSASATHAASPVSLLNRLRSLVCIPKSLRCACRLVGHAANT